MRFKRAGFLTKIVVLALLIYMATTLLDLEGTDPDHPGPAGRAGPAGGDQRQKIRS